MLARAALIGRVTREREQARRASNLPPIDRRKKKKQVELIDPPKLSGFFTHCSRGSLISLGAAMLLIAIGAIMCNFAFHARSYATRTVSVGNRTEDIVNKSAYMGLRSMTYIGPTFMGVGAFLIIVFCVVLFDTREKTIKQAIQKQIQQQQDMSQEYAIKAVLSRSESNGGKKPSIKGKKPNDKPQTSQQKYHAVENKETIATTVEDKLAEDKSAADTNTEDITPPVTIETVCEQLNSVSTLSQPETPKIQLKTVQNNNKTLAATSAADVFFQLSKMSSLSCENGPIITHHGPEPKTSCNDGIHCNENLGFENSNYDLRSQLVSETPCRNGEVIAEDPQQNVSLLNIMPKAATNNEHRVTIEHTENNVSHQGMHTDEDDDDTRPLCDTPVIQATYV